MHAVAIQHDVRWEDKPATHAIVERMLDDADPPPGSVVLLPELFDTGFSLKVDRIADGATLPWATAAARRRSCTIICGFADRGDDGLGRNCASIVSPAGDELGRYEKVHPFSYGRETDAYAPGRRLVLRSIEGAVVCPLICYDLRFPELWRLAALAGAEVFFIGASWPSARHAHWRDLCVARAIENQAYIVAVNRTGRDPFLEYAGGSLIVSPRGTIIVEAGDAPAVLQAELDLDDLREWRRTFPALRDVRREHLGSIEVDGPRSAD